MFECLTDKEMSGCNKSKIKTELTLRVKAKEYEKIVFDHFSKFNLNWLSTMIKEETGLQCCFCLNILSLFARKYGNISFVGKCLYPIEQKATSIIMLCNLAIKSYQPS